MTERVAFVLGIDPTTNHGGDTTTYEVLRSIAAERFEVELICLSDRPDQIGDDVVRVPKPPIAWSDLARRTVTQRRSALHLRFDVDGLRDAIARSSADRIVAMHAHLAEPVLRAAGVDAGERLLVNTTVLESRLWGAIYGPVGRLEERRIARDELRVAAAARNTACYDEREVATLRSGGVRAEWLPLTLPPRPAVNLGDTPPRLVMLGYRGWRPNAKAAADIVRWWPRIREGIPEAELWIVGATPDGAGRTLPEGVRDLGRVDDVDAVLAQARALTAPVGIGGGVRVKLLEAAARGLPAICTPAAIGSIETHLGFTAAPDQDAFVARCRALLSDADEAASEGGRLHARNTELWEGRVPQDAVLRWLTS